jgi:hypothetical protein
MSSYTAPLSDLRFGLHDVLKVEPLFARLGFTDATADVVNVELQPSSAARIVVADALAGNRTLGYSLKGTVAATPQEKKQRSFEIDSRSTLNQAPGLPGVLR